MMTGVTGVEEQYRRAPLDGLIIGAIVGAIWGVVCLVSRVFSWTCEEIVSFGGDYCGYSQVLVTSFIFPGIGLLAGWWKKAAVFRCQGVKYKSRVAAITAAMAVLAGVILACDMWFGAYLIDIKSKAVLVVVVVVMFALSGWILGIVGASIRGDDHFRIEMVIVTTFALYLSFFVVFFLSILLRIMIFGI